MKGIDEYLLTKMKEIRKNSTEIEYIRQNIQPYHAHVVSFPPKYNIAKVVQVIKSTAGKMIWEKFGFLKERYYGHDKIRPAGYFVSTEGLDENLIKSYGQYQKKEDLGQAELELD